MLHSVKVLLVNWQLWLRLSLAFVIPMIVLAGILKASEEQLNQLLGEAPPKPKLALAGQLFLPTVLQEKLQEKTSVTLFDTEAELVEQVNNDSVDVGLWVPENFYQDSLFQDQLKIHFNSMKHHGEYSAVMEIIEGYENELVRENIETLGLPEKTTNPIQVAENNTFNPLLMIGQVLEDSKGMMANILNLCFFILLIWLVRHLVLRVALDPVRSVWLVNMLLIWLLALVGMVLVFMGLLKGLEVDLVGLVKGLVLNLEQLLTWERLSPLLYLWLPLWWGIVGLMSVFALISKKATHAHTFTFWLTVLLLGAASAATVPVETLESWMVYAPVYNVVAASQLILRKSLKTADFWLILGSTLVWGMLAQLIAYALKRRNSKAVASESL